MPDQFLQEKLTAAFATSDRPMSVLEVLARCHADASRFRVQLALDALVTLGEVERIAEVDPASRRPIVMYRLRSKSTEESP
jgi:hypothetical protein